MSDNHTASTAVRFDEANGIVHVSGVPLSSYTGWQHPFMTPVALGRLGVHCRRVAFDSGWLDPSRSFFSLSRDSSARRKVDVAVMSSAPFAAHGAVSGVGHDVSTSGFTFADTASSPSDRSASSLSPSFSTVFVVAMEIKLAANFTARPIHNMVSARAEVFVANVGSSSFALGGRFFAFFPAAAPLAPTDPASGSSSSSTTVSLSGIGGVEVYLGTVQLSYVHVDFASRRAMQLPDSKRGPLEAAFRSQNVSDAALVKLSRLPPKAILDAVRQSPLVFSNTVVLRPSDFDFNLHLNQSLYSGFALDTLKVGLLHWMNVWASEDRGGGGATNREADDGTSERRTCLLLPLMRVVCSSAPSSESEVASLFASSERRAQLEAAVLQLDAAVREIRIDFVKEIPMKLYRREDGSCSDDPVSVTVAVVDVPDGDHQTSSEVVFVVESAPGTKGEMLHSVGKLILADL